MRWIVCLLQIIALLRVVRRFGGRRVGPIPRVRPHLVDVSIVVPVLNEATRIGPLLSAIAAMPVHDIAVIDGGSNDGTQALAQSRGVRVLDASPVPDDWNGKAWGLETGLRQATAEWLLCLDADVRPDPALASSLVTFATDHDLDMLSIATTQSLGDALDGLVHPALLTTLVYRVGPPGRIFRSVAEATANGQVLLLRRSVIDQVGFGPVKRSRCEDVTLARLLVSEGRRVAFAEGPGLASVQMYSGGCETLANWARSMALNDQFESGWSGLIEVTLIQALPLLLAVIYRGSRSAVVQYCLLAVRIGMLAGMSRAYRNAPGTYWISPIVDLPVVALLWMSRVRKRQRWRGRWLRDESP